MNVETLTGAILSKMSGIRKSCLKFFISLPTLLISMRGRKNFMMMGRYGTYNEQTYRNHFDRSFDFVEFNTTLIKESCGSELIWAFDPSYMPKSGKHTPGVGYVWSGCANAVKWGLELSAFAVVDLENNTAMHYDCCQTFYSKKESGTLLEYYASLILSRKEKMLKIAKIIAVDAFFSKMSFINPLCNAGFTVISRLANNAHMRYLYTGEQKGGRGAKKKYGAKVDIKKLDTQYMKVIKSDENEILYEGLLQIRSLKRVCKVVIRHTLDHEGKVKNAYIYFSTDTSMLGLKVIEYYTKRFQIEFEFRDGNKIGLEDCQSRNKEAINYHFNAVLTALNLAKAAHWLSIPKEDRGAFSIEDIKTQYFNELMLDELISIYGKDPQIEKMKPEIKKLYNLGKIAA